MFCCKSSFQSSSCVDGFILVKSGFHYCLNDIKFPRSCGCKHTGMYHHSTNILDKHICGGVHYNKTCHPWILFQNFCSDKVLPTQIYTFFWREKTCLATLPLKLYLFNLFLIVLSWTLTFNVLTKTCTTWDFFVSSDFGIHLLGLPLLQRLATGLMALEWSISNCF